MENSIWRERVIYQATKIEKRIFPYTLLNIDSHLIIFDDRNSQMCKSINLKANRLECQINKTAV